MTDSLIEIPARRGKATFVFAGQTITVINIHGEPVVDTWAFDRADLREFMANEHTQVHGLHLIPRPEEILRTTSAGPREAKPPGRLRAWSVLEQALA